MYFSTEKVQLCCYAAPHNFFVCNGNYAGLRDGKTPKDRTLTKQARAQEYQDICDRNEVEGVFGTGKTAYGLGRITAHLKETTFCVIGVALILMNLTRRLRSLLRLFFCWLQWGDCGFALMAA